jgi:uncharacterized membrane protein YkvA (DUF1232 family)
VNAYDRLLGLVGRLVTARYPERGAEIVETARAAGRDGGRWAELASLLGLALRCRSSARAIWVQGALLAAVLLLVAPVPIAVPFVLLALGLVDARFAAAATLFWLVRLVTADFADPQILRWVGMLIGVVLAAHVTRASIRRAAAL